MRVGEDYWYKQKNQKLNVGDWFYLTGGTVHKLKLQQVVNIKLGAKTTLNTGEIYKICRIEHKFNRIYFLKSETIKIKT